MKRTRWFALALLLLFLPPRGTLFAQEMRATLSGTVTDPSGAAIPNANLTLLNAKTNVSVTAKSNGEGQYRVLFIDPGSYTLGAEAVGFSKYLESNISLTVSQASTVDVKLTIGSESQ